MMHGYDVHGWWWLISILVVAMLAWIFISLFQNTKSRDPVDILKDRYVRGEIDRNEYEEKRKDLQN